MYDYIQQLNGQNLGLSLCQWIIAVSIQFKEEASATVLL